MKFDKSYPASEIADWIGAEVIGDPAMELTGLNEIHKVEPGDIMFVDAKKYFDKALSSAATGIILNEKVEAPDGKVLFVVPDPFRAYETVARRFFTFEAQNSSIHPSANIHPTAQLEPGVVVGRNVEIGAHSIIQANTFIGNETRIGREVWIQPNCTIGSEAFYFQHKSSGYDMWTSVGRVIIHDRVTIGANCTIDKGVSGDTVVGEGSKLDNLVHLGHGVVLGRHCLLAGQVGIGGKTVVGDHVTMYGQVGLINNLKVGDRVTILAQSGVTKDLKEGTTYFGTPAEESRSWLKEKARIKRLLRDQQDNK